jgi:hypothetical protein
MNLMKNILWTGLLVLVLGAVLCLPAVAAPGLGADSTQITGRVPFAPEVHEARLAGIAWLTAVADARMEGTITYIGGISNGTGTGDLTELRQEFSVRSAELAQDTTRADILEDRSVILRVRNEFRNETRDMMNQYGGNRTELREAVQASVAAHNETLTRLREAFDGKRDTVVLAVFDRQTDRGDQRLETLQAKGLDTSVPQATLQEIEEHGATLGAALAADDRAAIKGELQEIRGLAQDFRLEVRSIAKEHPKKLTN